MAKVALPSLKADRAIKKLARDVAIARRRRHFTQQRLADGAGIGIATVRRLEAGDPGISIGNLMMVLTALGEGERLANLLDMSKDDVGLMMSADSLPQRVRDSRQSIVSLKSAGDRESDEGYIDGSDF